MGRPAATSKWFDVGIYTLIGLPCFFAGLAYWPLLIPGVVLMVLATRAAWREG